MLIWTTHAKKYFQIVDSLIMVLKDVHFVNMAETSLMEHAEKTFIKTV